MYKVVRFTDGTYQHSQVLGKYLTLSGGRAALVAYATANPNPSTFNLVSPQGSFWYEYDVDTRKVILHTRFKDGIKLA